MTQHQKRSRVVGICFHCLKIIDTITLITNKYIQQLCTFTHFQKITKGGRVIFQFPKHNAKLQQPLSIFCRHLQGRLQPKTIKAHRQVIKHEDK